MHNFKAEYKEAFEDMVLHHVRDGQQEEFLVKMYKNTNAHAGSTVWGVVGELLKEMFDYTDEMLSNILR